MSQQPDDKDSFVDRFLCWRLPDTFNPDCGISFKKLNHPNAWPVGTNLFTADEATQMFTQIVKPLLDAKQAQIDRLMLEFCPEEMTKEQMAEWEKHQHAASPEAEASINSAIVRPELQPLSGETPRTDALMKYIASDMVGHDEPPIIQMTKHAEQLEREVYFWKNDAGRFEESNRQARETIDDLRQELAEAQDELRMSKGFGAALDCTLEAVSTRGASSACPMDGINKPHFHSVEQVIEWLKIQAARFLNEGDKDKVFVIRGDHYQQAEPQAWQIVNPEGRVVDTVSYQDRRDRYSDQAYTKVPLYHAPLSAIGTRS